MTATLKDTRFYTKILKLAPPPHLWCVANTGRLDHVDLAHAVSPKHHREIRNKWVFFLVTLALGSLDMQVNNMQGDYTRGLVL